MKPLNERLGNCYEFAYMSLLGAIGTSDKRWVLVHGYPRLTKEDQGQPVGTMYGHAWLELETPDVSIVFDAVLCTFSRKDLYYEAGQIKPEQCAVFTLEEAHKQRDETDHVGPWGVIPSEAKFADD